MKLNKYRGIVPALYTCYDKAEEVSEDGVQVLTRYPVDQGVRGVYVGGSSGECIYQSVEGKKKTPEAVMNEVVGCLTAVAHIACNDTKDSRILATHAQGLSVDGIAAVPPTYFRLPEYLVTGYWNDISEAVLETDLAIYNIPQLAGIALIMNLLETMLLGSQVAGVKNLSIPVQDIQMLKAGTMKTRQDFIVFNDSNEQLVPGLAMGVNGKIDGTYGAMPKLFLEIYELMSENRTAEVRIIQYEADEVMYKFCSGACNMYAIIREVLHINRGIDIGGVRKPPTDLCGNDRAIAKEAAAVIEDVKERYCWYGMRPADQYRKLQGHEQESG